MKKKLKKGFTLVELVVVIAVIAILAGVSIGAYFGITDSANASKLEQEAKQVHTAIQTAALAPNEHSSLTSNGLTITDAFEFEDALEKNLGVNVYLTNDANKKDDDLPTIYFSEDSLSSLVEENKLYKSFDYHLPEIGNKKASCDVVNGEVKVVTSNAEVIDGEIKPGSEGGNTTVPGGEQPNTSTYPTIEPEVEVTIEPSIDPTVTSSDPVTTTKIYTKVMHDLVEWTGKYVIASNNNVFDSSTTATIGNSITDESLYVLDNTNKTIKINEIYTFEVEASDEANKFYIKKSDGKYLSFSGTESTIKYTEKDEAKKVTLTVNEGTAEVALSDDPTFMLKCEDNTKFKFYNDNYPKVSLYKESSEISYKEAEYIDIEVPASMTLAFPSSSSRIIRPKPVISNGDRTNLPECDITFTSNDINVVTVTDDGKVTAKGIGITTITVGLLVNESVIISKNIEVIVNNFYDSPTAGTITFNDLSKLIEKSTTKQVWEENSIKAIYEKGSSTNDLVEIANPAKFFANTKLTVEAPANISTIVFNCHSYEYATELKNSIGNTATVSIFSARVTVTLDGSSSSFVIAQLTAEVRMESLTVTYLP